MSLSKYVNTIRYLKFEQIFFQLKNRIDPRWWRFEKSPQLEVRDIPAVHFLEKKEKTLLKGGVFRFLNEEHRFADTGWMTATSGTPSALWKYNQHYFDFLNQEHTPDFMDCCEEMIQNWVAECGQDTQEIAWDAYPTSLRIVNWVKWHFQRRHLSSQAIDSLWNQGLWLETRLERHLLGNHLFANLKALVFFGIFFSDDRLVNSTVKLLKRELDRQILGDGGHFELTPMYHSIILEDVLDVLNLALTCENRELRETLPLITNVAEKMCGWLTKMSHPDGDIAFFNDAALKIAPRPMEILNYAARLGLKMTPETSATYEGVTVENMSASGYIKVGTSEFSAILDVARVGPTYIPGHAHADTLSFELACCNQRVFVNSGISTYEIGTTRQFERSTKAHNTVVVDDADSSHVWAAFRVAKRAVPIGLEIQKSLNCVTVQCGHNGYQTTRKKRLHHRTWQIRPSQMVIRDSVIGLHHSAVAMFYIHPDVLLKRLTSSAFVLEMPNRFEIEIQVQIGIAEIQPFVFRPEMGRGVDSRCLSITLERGKSAVAINFQ